MSTESFDKYMSKLRFIIENECDGSRMSDMKWKVLLESLFLLRKTIAFYCRVKILDDKTACNWGMSIPPLIHKTVRLDGSERIWIEPDGWPVPSIAIEWMEFLTSDYQYQIEEQLDALHIPYTAEGDIIRVTGHVRRSTPPIITRSR